jgi:hypothetical protein
MLSDDGCRLSSADCRMSRNSWLLLVPGCGVFVVDCVCRLSLNFSIFGA